MICERVYTKEVRCQEDSVILLLSDPAYEYWSMERQAENEKFFDDWIDTMEGIKWLNDQIAENEERLCISQWNGW